MPYRKVHAGVLAAVVLLVAGCGKKLVPVEGKVLLNGDPLANAMIVFIPNETAEERSDLCGAAALTDQDGSFSLRTLNSAGAFPGEYRVVVSKQALRPQAKPADPRRILPAAANGTPPTSTSPPLPAELVASPGFSELTKYVTLAKKAKEIVPSNYTTPDTTPLRVEVPRGGRKEFEINLDK